MNYHIDLSPPDTPETLPNLSLYTTGKPVKEDYRYVDGLHSGILDSGGYNYAKTKWYSNSRYAYLQEPEWKKGDIVYDREGVEYEYTELIEGAIAAYGKKKGEEWVDSRIDKLSHYRPGQIVPSSAISYVRLRNGFAVGDNVITDDIKVTDAEGIECVAVSYDGMQAKISDLDEDGNCVIKVTDDGAEIECHINDLIHTEWQPSPEPEKPKLRGKFSKLTETYSRDYDNYKSAHTKWLKKLRSGTVQAVINQTKQ